VAKILVADDSSDIRHLLSAILVEEGHSVTTASDGAKAVEMMAEEAPELLVLDVMMPRLDGYGVLTSMQETGLLSEVKVLILTAKTSEADWARGYKLGADQYLTKPFGSDELLQSVTNLLETSKADLKVKTEEELDRAQLLSRLESIFTDF
jgi:DNA-binding response OmpR family regulator